MKTKAKSVQVFEVRLWSKKYYKRDLTPKHKVNIYDGHIIDSKTKERIHFHSAADFLRAIEMMYLKAEKV